MITTILTAEIHGTKYRVALELEDRRKAGGAVTLSANLSTRTGFGGSSRHVSAKLVPPVIADLVTGVRAGDYPGVLADALEEADYDHGVYSTVRLGMLADW